MSVLKYRPDVDGLRAVAVLAVLFYHAGIGCPGGYIGVDVFFVISGYLITGLLVNDLDAGRFTVRRFWERRIRRLMPAYTVLVVSCLVAGWMVLLPGDFERLARSVVAQSFLASNIYFWRHSGYFAPGAETQPMLHTWSLAVEEQFYLIFPVVLMLIYRKARRYLMPVMLLGCVCSLIISVYGSYRHPDATFYLLPTRAWELGLGATLAILPSRLTPSVIVAQVMSWFGLFAILYSAFFYSQETRFPGMAALLPCLGAFCLIWSNMYAKTLLGRFLSLRPVVFIGLISYSLYLWHWPLFFYTRYIVPGPPHWQLRLLLLLSSVVVAAISWKYVETPFRRGLMLKKPSSVFMMAGTMTVLLLGTGLSVQRAQGVPERYSQPALQYAKGLSDRGFLFELNLDDVQSQRFVELGIDDRKLPPRLFVWGDSQAMSAMPAIDTLCRRYRVRGLAATRSATCPLIGLISQGRYSLGQRSQDYNAAVVDYIRKECIPDVILIARWGMYVNHGDLYKAMIDTVEALNGACKRVWIMKEVPRSQCVNPPAALARATMMARSPMELEIPLDEHRRMCRVQHSILGRVSKRYTHVRILDPERFFVRETGTCRIEKHGKSLYYDQGHLTATGAMELIPLFEPVFRPRVIRYKCSDGHRHGSGQAAVRMFRP